MDNLLEALKTGSCFNREKRDAKRKTPRAAGGKLSSCGVTTYTVIQTVTFSMNTLNFCEFVFHPAIYRFTTSREIVHLYSDYRGNTQAGRVQSLRHRSYLQENLCLKSFTWIYFGDINWSLKTPDYFIRGFGFLCVFVCIFIARKQNNLQIQR